MIVPYLLMSLLFIALALLQALDTSLIGLGLAPGLSGLRWLRIHFITLGVLTEVLFGVLPLLVARYNSLPRPAMRWDIWLALNAGILALLVGIPQINQGGIYVGGGLVFTAAALLIHQLWNLRGDATGRAGGGRSFYLAGLAFFLLGIILGTGLWFGWGAWLRVYNPLEVHIHANNWGLMSLLFAGLIVDLYPRWTGRSLAWPWSARTIFWMMSLGALGLVLGPWFNTLWFTVPGLLLHLGATIWLLLNVSKPLWGDRAAWTPGMLHLVTAYVWILVPVLTAPLLIIGVGNLPGGDIEANAPQALIYGWLLQVGFALLPYFFQRAFQPKETARLGGSRLSLLTAHAGGIFLWIGIFLPSSRGLLHGIAYGLWTVAFLPIALALWRITRAGLSGLEAIPFPES